MSAVLATLLTAVLAVAGCGAGSTTTTTTLSKQEYATKIGQIVTMINAAQQHPSPGPRTPTSVAASQVASFDDALKKAAQQLAALNPPSHATNTNADFVTAINTYEKSIAQYEQALRSGNKQQISAQNQPTGSAVLTFQSTLHQIGSQLRSEGIPLRGS